jgi:ATP-dependent DNA helicase RecQ
VHLIDVLRGRDNERTGRWHHDKLSVFGVGADLDEVAWRGVFRQLVALGFARVDFDAHGALKLTEASRPVLRGEQRVEMRRLAARRRPAPASRIGAAGDLPPADAHLLERLKAWRLAEARTQSVPAYVILHDTTLTEIARRRPPDLGALSGVGGIGAKKLDRYGSALLELVAGQDAHS